MTLILRSTAEQYCLLVTFVVFDVSYDICQSLVHKHTVKSFQSIVKHLQAKINAVLDSRQNLCSIVRLKRCKSAPWNT